MRTFCLLTYPESWICASSEKKFVFSAKPLYQRLIDISGYDGSILVSDNIQTETSITGLFKKLVEEMYSTFKGTLKCGNLESKIILSPAPVVSIF